MALNDVNAILPQARDQHSIARVISLERPPITNFHGLPAKMLWINLSSEQLLLDIFRTSVNDGSGFRRGIRMLFERQIALFDGYRVNARRVPFHSQSGDL